MMAHSYLSIQRLNPRFLWIKNLLPIAIRRVILTHVFGVNKDFVSPPSRRWLESDVLPMLPSSGFRRVLFVGTAPYTFNYERIFRKAGGVWVTSDANPSARVWGARKHVTAPVQHVDRHFAKAAFDAVIVNGVFGFGVDSDLEMNKSIAAIKRVLRPGGLFLIGWNTDKVTNPLELEEMRRGFRPASEIPFPAHCAFAAETHVYEFQIWDPRIPGSPP